MIFISHNHTHSHNKHHGHSHDVENVSIKKLWISIFLNFFITVIQIVGGIISNSLALISDSLHNLTDTVSIVLSLIGIKISKRESDEKRTFGYKRAEIIVALVNTLGLFAISIFLFVEAFKRLINPQHINGEIMFIIALGGLIANSISAILLFTDSKESLNIRSAFLHILSDALSSVAVIIGGILIIYKQWFIVDPILTFAIGVYVFISSYSLLKETIHILMQGTPVDISIDKIIEIIERIEKVNNIHHIHIWTLTGKEKFFEAHVCIEKMDMLEVEKLKLEIKDILKREFNIEHSTLEFELMGCTDKVIQN